MYLNYLNRGIFGLRNEETYRKRLSREQFESTKRCKSVGSLSILAAAIAGKRSRSVAGGANKNLIKSMNLGV